MFVLERSLQRCLRRSGLPPPRSYRFISQTLGKPNTLAAHSTIPTLKPNAYQNALHKTIVDTIKGTGPLSVSQYMQLCLSHPTEGYYMKGDVFGAKGDFITSPEISQVFGELMAVWFVTQWVKDGKPPKARIIELGPGRGTLMDDLLRTLARFQPAGLSISDVHLVETSHALRAVQESKLSKRDITLHWHDQIESIKPDNSYTIVVAHEFFDALPIHILENTPQGYREIFVDLDHPIIESHSRSHQLPLEGTHKLRFALAPGSTAMASGLAASSPRFANRPIGSRLEVSPASWRIAQKVGELVGGLGGGSGLIVDYGDSHSFGNSFRAFKQHKIVDVLGRPGDADLTANVDFAYLSEAISALASCHGPVTQRDFLLRMGLEPRVVALKDATSSDARRLDIQNAAMRLIDSTGMGTQYKVMAVTSKVSDEPPYPFMKPTKTSEGTGL